MQTIVTDENEKKPEPEAVTMDVVEMCLVNLEKIVASGDIPKSESFPP